MNRILLLAIGAVTMVSTPAMSADIGARQATGRAGSSLRKSNIFHNVSNRLAQKKTVLAEKKVAEGVVLRAVRTSDGRIYKEVERNGVVTPAPQKRVSFLEPQMGTSFYEGFEGWDEKTYDWIPEGWTEINTPENVSNQAMLERNINNTWYGTWTGDGYWTGITKDGEKECFIHFTYSGEYTDDEGNEVEFKAAPQDEWLITPQFKLGDMHKLFFELEIDEGGIFKYDWNTRSYDRNVLDHNLEILVSSDNGENWDRIWIASEDLVADKSDSELYDKLAVLRYQSMVIDIPEQYFGKDIKIAFRYTNRGSDVICGNSMAIDAVNVGASMPEARYNLPTGTLLTGLSRDFYAFNVPYALLPAYKDITWNSACNTYTEAIDWHVYNQETGNMEDMSGNSVTTYYAYSEGNAYPYPVLTAKNIFGQDVYDFGVVEDNEDKGGVLYGGSMVSNGTEFGAGVYDYAHCSMYPAYFTDGNYCFGTTAKDTWGEGISQESAANIYDAPPAPYAIDEIYVTLGALDADPDAEITLEVLGFFEDGTLDDYSPLATAVAKVSDAVKEGDFYQLPFKFYAKDENGNSVQTYFVYDQPMVIDIYGYNNNPKIRKFGICTQYFSNESGKNYAAMRIKFENENLTQWYTADQALQDFYNALYITFFGSYNFLEPEEWVIDIDPETRRAGTYVNAANSPEDWWIEYDGKKYPMLEGATLDEWLTVSVMTMNDEHRLSFKATETDEARSLNFLLCTKGVSTGFVVNQDSTNGVYVVGEAKDVKEIRYVNTMGQTVDGDSKGIVIKTVTFADGTVRAYKIVNR